MIRDAACALVFLVILLYGLAVVQELDEANEPTERAIAAHDNTDFQPRSTN